MTRDLAGITALHADAPVRRNVLGGRGIPVPNVHTRPGDLKADEQSLSELTVEEARAQERAALQARTAVPEHVDEVTDLAIPGPGGPIPTRLYLPARLARPAPTLVWFPGGGWVVGTLEAADLVCRKLANETPCAVVAVEYRQAPEHRFPAAVDDCLAATEWAAGNARRLELDPMRIAIGGASAGGNLAAVVAHLARDQGGPPIVFQLLVYPATDHRARGDTDVPGSFDRAGADWCWSHYLGDASGDDPRASPLRARDFRRLPPALLIAAEHDPLREETELYARALATAGVETEHLCFEAAHGFFSTPGSTAADAARTRAVNALRSAFGDRMPGGTQ
jgi:acetyl esterase/lipase